MFEKIPRFFKREILHRRLPHGIVNWRYLFPCHDPLLRAHRQLWWGSCGSWFRPLWCVIELWLWLRWVLCHAWLSSIRMSRRYGTEIPAEENISRFRFGLAVLKLSICWSIPPNETLRFQLYRKPASMLDYVYDHESSPFHQTRNRVMGADGTSQRILQDKLELAEKLSAIGVPMVPTARVVTRKSGCTLTSQSDLPDSVFCKTRSGNQGLGAFTLWRTTGGMHGRSFDGRELATVTDVEATWQELLKLDDALVQPCLANHPSLAPMSSNGDAITVRFITQWEEGRINCLSATLEVPAGRGKSIGRTIYCIYPVNFETGEMTPFPDHLLATRTAKSLNMGIWNLAPSDRRIPWWNDLRAFSYQAHDQFPDIWGIAWDWVVTPDGPVLLEGNCGWGMGIPQVLSGGLLSAKTWATVCRLR